MQPLSEPQLFRINQSESTRKILDFEDGNNAREREAARLERIEADYQKSLKIAAGHLVSEWEEIPTARSVRRRRTGRLCLDGEVVTRKSKLRVYIGKKSVNVEVEYITREREIIGCIGNVSDTDEVIRLQQGQRAKRIVEPEPEEPEPDEWTLKYKSGKWHVVKPGGLFAGSYTDLEAAQHLVEVLRANDAIKPSSDIHYRTV